MSEHAAANPQNPPRALVVAWFVTLLVLLAVTWRLWTPLREVPRLPPVAVMSVLPAGLDFACLLMIAVVAIRAARSPIDARVAIGVATVALALSMAMDQLRWQPWAHHALLAGAVLATATPRRAVVALRWIAIAVYAYSALSKLDAEFAATLGQQMLNAAVGGVGLDASTWGETFRRLLALTLPLGELAVAGLLVASTRYQKVAPYAVGAAVAMHVGVIALLGPLGLGHSWGVLLWNVGFAWQTALLFGSKLPEPIEPSVRTPLVVWIAGAAAIVAPVLTPLGLWDQWPGWAVYAPGGERARLFVHEAAADRLPVTLREHVKRASDPGPWRRVAIDDWLLAGTGAPIYPQNRVVAALASGLAKRYALTDRLQLVLETPANRLTRERESVTLTSADELLEASHLFWPVSPAVWTR
ncbi:hypothetical protein MalM25_13870 [Planctomycetes bacterium MalM25]|nr:hypothetical protein MalM25_13870 [Planctomycetes bacterium MalM25]